MYCTSCGKPTPNTSIFCLHCGDKILDCTDPLGRPPRQVIRNSVAPSAKHKSRAGLIVGIIGLLIFIGGGLLLLGVVFEAQRRNSLTSSGVNGASSTLSDLPRRLIAQRTPLTPPAFVVEPGRYSSWRFNVASGGRVVGSFRSDTNIVVGIFDAENFNLFQNDKSCRSYYSSGKIPSGNINVPLPAGSYAIVFSNTYSFFSTKNITADISIEQ